MSDLRCELPLLKITLPYEETRGPHRLGLLAQIGDRWKERKMSTFRDQRWSDLKDFNWLY